MASYNQVGEYEMTADFESRPSEGTPAEAALVGLIGPLRFAAAQQAEGRLTHKLWEHLAAFASEFAALS